MDRNVIKKRIIPRIFAGAALLLVLLASPVQAQSLRCGNRLVTHGDRMFEVRMLCGEPDIKVLIQSALSANFEVLPYEEEWQYNFGPQKLMQYLRFRNNRLIGVFSGSHGFARPNERCQPFELREGLSTLELLARCGEPTVVERRISTHAYRLGPTGPLFPAGIAVDDWIYDFGGGRFHRIVTVIDGRVVRIENSRYRG